MSKWKLILKLLNIKWLGKRFKIIYLLNIHADQLDTDTHMYMHTLKSNSLDQENE